MWKTLYLFMSFCSLSLFTTSFHLIDCCKSLFNLPSSSQLLAKNTHEYKKRWKFIHLQAIAKAQHKKNPCWNGGNLLAGYNMLWLIQKHWFAKIAFFACFCVCVLERKRAILAPCFHIIISSVVCLGNIHFIWISIKYRFSAQRFFHLSACRDFLSLSLTVDVSHYAVSMCCARVAIRNSRKKRRENNNKKAVPGYGEKFAWNSNQFSFSMTMEFV